LQNALRDKFQCTHGHLADRVDGISMKIAQTAPLYEAVPPKLYGGTNASWRS
jgi:hypothetical protein